MATTKTKFDGIDYAELADHFGIDLEAGRLEDLEDFEVISEWLFANGFADEHGQTPKPEVIAVLRKFLKELIKQDGTYSTELWKGLSRIKNDWTFQRYFRYLMGYMWT